MTVVDISTEDVATCSAVTATSTSNAVNVHAMIARAHEMFREARGPSTTRGDSNTRAGSSTRSVASNEALIACMLYLDETVMAELVDSGHDGLGRLATCATTLLPLLTDVLAMSDECENDCAMVDAVIGRLVRCFAEKLVTVGLLWWALVDGDDVPTDVEQYRRQFITALVRVLDDRTRESDAHSQVTIMVPLSHWVTSVTSSSTTVNGNAINSLVRVLYLIAKFHGCLRLTCAAMHLRDMVEQLMTSTVVRDAVLGHRVLALRLLVAYVNVHVNYESFTTERVRPLIHAHAISLIELIFTNDATDWMGSVDRDDDMSCIFFATLLPWMLRTCVDVWSFHAALDGVMRAWFMHGATLRGTIQQTQDDVNQMICTAMLATPQIVQHVGTVLVAWISSKNEASACIPALCQFIRSLRHCSTNYSTHATALYNRINTCIHKRLYDALVGGDSHDQALYLQCMLDVIVEGDSPTSSNVASMMPLHAVITAAEHQLQHVYAATQPGQCVSEEFMMVLRYLLWRLPFAEDNGAWPRPIFFETLHDMATRDMHMTSPFSTLVLRLQHVFMMHAGVVPGYIDIAKIAALVHHYVNCDDALFHIGFLIDILSISKPPHRISKHALHRLWHTALQCQAAHHLQYLQPSIRAAYLTQVTRLIDAVTVYARATYPTLHETICSRTAQTTSWTWLDVAERAVKIA